jgi:hypothetical protein
VDNPTLSLFIDCFSITPFFLSGVVAGGWCKRFSI